MKGVRLLGVRLGTSECTGTLPFIEDLIELAIVPISEGRPFTFCKKNFGKPLYPYQRVVTVE